MFHSSKDTVLYVAISNSCKILSLYILIFYFLLIRNCVSIVWCQSLLTQRKFLTAREFIFHIFLGSLMPESTLLMLSMKLVFQSLKQFGWNLSRQLPDIEASLFLTKKNLRSNSYKIKKEKKEQKVERVENQDISEEMRVMDLALIKTEAKTQEQNQ